MISRLLLRLRLLQQLMLRRRLLQRQRLLRRLRLRLLLLRLMLLLLLLDRHQRNAISRQLARPQQMHRHVGHHLAIALEPLLDHL
jgi:hypothetical protein